MTPPTAGSTAPRSALALLTGGVVAAGIALGTSHEGLLERGREQVRLAMAQDEGSAAEGSAAGGGGAEPPPPVEGAAGDEDPAEETPQGAPPAEVAAEASTPPGGAKAPRVEARTMDTAEEARPFSPQRLTCTTESLSSTGLIDELRRAGTRNAAEREQIAAERAELAALKEELVTARRQLEKSIAQEELGAATAAPSIDGGRAVLADAIRNMPSSRAAALLAALDDATAGDVLRRLKAKDAGAVLAVMEPARARTLVVYLAKNGTAAKGSTR
jgi:flagellar motility protein MotE (MotC chaperone)